MNANEVLANIGLELTGHKKGEYQYLEPHDDLNMSQSANDSYPTDIKVALIFLNGKLVEELQMLADSFRAKGKQYLMVVKMGRTELQDAVPRTRASSPPRTRKWRAMRATTAKAPCCWAANTGGSAPPLYRSAVRPSMAATSLQLGASREKRVPTTPSREPSER